MSHTQTPWRLARPAKTDVTNYVFGPKGQIAHVGAYGTQEDAAFIVKACNAHDELVAVLQDIVAADGMRPGHVAYKSRADIAAMARAALAKAGAL